MMDAQDVLALAIQLGGQEADARSEALFTLCQAAVSAVKARLTTQTDGDEPAVRTAAAYLALSWLPRPEAQSFTAGNISVQRESADNRSSYYLSVAERLLAPFAKTSEFAFRGVGD